MPEIILRKFHHSNYPHLDFQIHILPSRKKVTIKKNYEKEFNNSYFLNYIFISDKGKFQRKINFI